MNEKILKLLAKNARYQAAEIAVMLGMTEDDVKKEITSMEEAGLIRGYKAVIDWGSVNSANVSALIELKVTPKAGYGFEQIAERVMHYPEVETVYLMSGGYDLTVIVRGKTFQEVAMFVAKELAPMESVTSTATHFVLRRYKEMDVELHSSDGDDRGAISL